MRDRLLALSVALLLATGWTAPLSAAEPETIEIQAVPGLEFSPARFVVEPGQQVELTFTVSDEMRHNLLITEPGERQTVAQLATDLGDAGPALAYTPETEKVLYATEVLEPGQTQTLVFQAPEEEGPYPYVCTFPGHASLMFGVMHVTTNAQALPPLAEDEHVPERIRLREAETSAAPGEAETLPLMHRRRFLPAASPAAIAVHAGRGLSFVWDATTCHLRYAWRDGFLAGAPGSMIAWDATIEGHVYYRAMDEFPIRLGSVAEIPERDYQAYEMVQGLPRFEFEIDGQTVRQHVRAMEEQAGLEMQFEMPGVNQRVYYVTDPEAGAIFSSDVGGWDDGVLTLEPEEAESFTIWLIERPGHAPVQGEFK